MFLPDELVCVEDLYIKTVIISRSARENFSIKNLNLIAALETSVGRAIMEDGTSINEVQKRWRSSGDLGPVYIKKSCPGKRVTFPTESS